ncbi:hypothetical protein [Streptomyces tropicalis]|uniref:Uncharacterized protein n=1 Tax=Streptomyces tropicalis TaxID=3034234 RepID=A0ABT6A6S9_9ACTN|nr:hypothetical protein [Streptomyces tropicalis]MDF3300081.1 hypothetical protein [Streptomyces tropicalis]
MTGTPSHDAGCRKAVPIRKRGLAVQVPGLAITLLGQVAEHAVSVEKALVDQGFVTAIEPNGPTLGSDVEIVERNQQCKRRRADRPDH